jgi:3-oxoadipate enol-lactonase
LVGNEDLPDMLKISKILAETIPGAQRRVMENAAHLPNLEEPESFNQLVQEFLSTDK